MQLEDVEVSKALKCLAIVELPQGIEDRLVSTCRSRLYEASHTRRTNVVGLTVVWTLTNSGLVLLALHAHQRHVRLKAALYGA